MAHVPDDSSDSNDVTEIPLELVSQPTVEEVDRVFIRKTVEYLQTLPGANSEQLKVQTNTTFPSRYVLMVSNLPSMKLVDFESIKTLAPRLRQISMSLKDNWMKIDMWKQGAQTRKPKRKFQSDTDREWNLDSIGANDQKMLKKILDGFSNLPSFPCQFHVNVKNQPPDYYLIDIVSNDIVLLDDVDGFKHTFRAFVKGIVFNFAANTVQMTIERPSASTTSEKRRVVVYKRSTTTM